MKKILVFAACAAVCAGAGAQINSQSADGCLFRAQQMMDNANYVGCLDQLQAASALPLNEEEAESAAFMKASAMMHVDKAEALKLVEQYLSQHSASSRGIEAKMLLGDCYYGNDYSQALKIYEEITPSTLPDSKADDLRYRMAYCNLQLKDYAKALTLFQQLGKSKEYADAALFYRGYIAYAQGKMIEAKNLLLKARSSQAPGNMADYYLCQIEFLNKNYAEALSAAKALLRRSGIATQYVAEANRIAGESAYYLGDQADAQKYLNAYVSLELSPENSALYILGLFAYNQGDYQRAVQLFTPATEAGDAMSQSAYLYIGQALLKDFDVDGAILAFDKAVKLDFDPAVEETAYYNYAVASLQGGKVPFGNTVSTFENFLKKFPNSDYAPEAQKYVISAYLNDHRYADALKSINAMKNPSADTNKAKLKVLYFLGAQSLANSKPIEAIQYLTEAQTLGRYDADLDREATLILGEAYFRNGNYDKAAQQARKYLAAANNSAVNKPIGYYDLGYALFSQGKYAEAAQSFKKVVDAPGQLSKAIIADANTRLGDAYRNTNQFVLAASAYDKAYSLNPAVGDYAIMQKGIMEGYQRNHTRKIALLKEMMEQYPSSSLIPDALLEMTEAYIQLGENKNAIATYRHLVDQYPNTAQGRQGYLQMALTMLNAGQSNDAIEAYKQVVTLYPTSEEALQAADQLKRLYAAEGRIGDYLSFIRNQPNAPQMDAEEADQVTFEVAEKAYLTQDQTHLLEAYVEQFTNGANRVRALAYLMDAYGDGSDADKAYHYACCIVDGYPDSALAVDALTVKGEHEMAEGKGALALRTFQQVEQKASNPADIDFARLKIAECAMLCNDTDEALRAADSLLASSSLSTAHRAQVLYIKGEAEAKYGNLEEARLYWEEAAEIGMAEEYAIHSAFALAQSLYDADQLKAAEVAAKKVTDADTPHTYWMARGFILLSDIYEKQGNHFKAQQYLKSLRDNYPGTEQDIFKMIETRIN